MKFKNFSLFQIYLALVSFISIIVIAINLGLMITSVAKFTIISDQEYIDNKGYYKLQNCENDSPTSDNKEDKTQKEIQKCKEEKKEEVLSSRSYDFKKDMIKSTAWLIPFIILFAYHYRKFLQQN